MAKRHAKPKPEPLPRLTQVVRDGEIAELRSTCTVDHQSDPETGVRPTCPITQTVLENRPDLHQVLTTCLNCERRRTFDCDPREKSPAARAGDGE